MSTKITGQRELELKSDDRMGVASPSTKRRIGSHEDDEVVSAKIARKLNNNNNDITLSLQDTTGNENSSDFLTTSILARTLLTTSSSGVGMNPHQFVGVGGSLCPASYALTPDPLESLKSSLEALPAPDIRPFFLSDKSTILSDHSDLEFSGLLCHERPLELASSVVTVLSPIDTESSPSKSSSSSAFGSGQHNQLITEDENGKSYFNLGSSDATIVARKSSRSSLDHVNSGGWNNCSTNLNGNLLNGSSSSSNDFDDNASSSSCESISSEDLFNSGEEFDASDDDEDELCSYKQQRSTVLHLSLCKLNKFRSQQCVEPSLHRSVLICNTLRHIEQEIKNEDEVDESLKSREKLPSFWRSTSNHCFSNSNNNPSPPSHQQPQITDSRPNNPAANNNNPNGSPMSPSNGLLSPGGHDPYLSSPNPYSEAPYLSYDYNSLRPTPYHTASYEYGEHDLPSSNNASPASQQLQQTSSSEIIGTSSSSTLLECDSGYGDDLDLSSYYYAPPPPPPSVQSPIMTSLIAPPPPTQMETSCSPTEFGTSPAVSQAVSQVASNNNSSISSSGCNSSVSNPTNSSSTSSNNSSSSSSSGSGGSVSPPHNHNNAAAAAAAAYLHCGFTSTLANASSSPTPGAISDNDVLMSGREIDSLAKSDLSDSRSSSPPESSPNSMTVLNGCHPNRSPPHGSTMTSSSNPSACDYLGRDFSSDNVGQSSMDMGRQPGDEVGWSSKSGKDLLGVGSSPNGGGGTVVVPVTSSLTSAGGNNNNNNNNVAFAQQESQCGIESRRSELSISSNHFSNHNLPMENLISSTYSSSL